MQTTRTLHASAALTLAATLAGCAAVGPDYNGPPEVAKSSIDQPAFARAAVAPVVVTSPPARWWEGVADPVLTQLIEEAFAASPTLKSALARVRAAQAQQAVNRAGLLPTGGASGRYVRGSIPTGALGAAAAGSGAAGEGGGTSLPDPIKLDSYSVSSNASWEIDIFGGTRRSIESAAAEVQAQQASLEDAQVTLASDMTQAYARLREAQTRYALTLRTIALRERALDLIRQRRGAGTAAQGDVERAEYELAQARAEVPGFKTRIEQQLDQVALLAGREPGAYDAQLAVADGQTPAMPMPPEAVPVGQPADWLRRRPDIRAAERALAARNAAIGQNVARLFPSVSLLGFIGTAGADAGDLFKGSPLWLLSPALTWNFLDIPANQARVRGAEAERDGSLADYERTVLAALQDANSSLSSFGRQRETLVLRDAARQAAARSEAIARQRHAGGTIGLGDALDAERQRAQAEDQWAQAGSGLMVAYATLQKSLGLGWGAPPPAPNVGLGKAVDPGAAPATASER